MRRLYSEIKYWSQLLLLPIYCLSFLIPRDNKTWVLGSTFGRSFADNPKYLYLYISGHKSEQVNPVWISKNKEVIRLIKENGLKGHYLYSLRGIWFCLRAKVYIYDNYTKDICYTLSAGAVKINLWHGLPLKKIQKDNIYDKFRNPKNIFERVYAIPRRISDEKPSHYVLSASGYFKNIFSSAFSTNNVIVEGYPRNDTFIADTINNVLNNSDCELINRLNRLKEKNKIVLYMPTFRDTELNFFDIIDIGNLSDFLSINNIVLCIKLHVKSKLQEKFIRLSEEKIIIAGSNVDPYPLCKLSDVLLTDYSSIYFDYLLTKKPIIFFPYDYEEYLSTTRELYFNYEKFTPGIKVKTQEELEKALVSVDNYEKQRHILSEKLFVKVNKPSSEGLYKAILNIIS